ncbi:MAG: response regulator, partial [Bdellovibrionales bacterium]|nr:response regulator [Bdellovibrionales bacterium]
MNRPKVLCVDDDELILEALRRVLDQEYQVFTSTSTEHALELLETDRHFDIVISDYQMPGKNGIEFLREVKRRYPICVRCLLTGQITLDEISEFINKNIFHKFLIKPWDNQQLLLQMKEALQLLTLLKEKESLSQLAITDPVTQLTNHRFFQ